MSQYYGAPPNQGYTPSGAQNLQFYSSNYAQPVSGHATPSQASYGYGGPSSGAYGASASFNSGFGDTSDVSGRMGEQGGLRTGWLAAFSTEGYPGEPPLLEELGVNISHIRAKTLAVLNPFSRIDQHLMDDSDLAGPLLSFLLYGTFLLLSGRVHFGYIYGLAVVGSLLLHGILSLMAPSPTDPSAAVSSTPSYPGVPSSAHPADASASISNAAATASGLTFARSASVLGYCLLPLVATSLVGIFMPMDKPVGITLSTAAIMWCTWSASGIFCAVGGMRGMRALVAYPLALFYVGFGIIAVFSSRGSGSFAKVAGASGAL
ncbi:Yip1-domain-containing protein [Parathielavia appendiculata]|uniref:Yip1-domain-containing protein n=1 Tax=Parathielavia appendiculata TaxID=2587402 RepID=A0AAN6U5F3_9PEZI|nr:Yip1-domain-containing protein [Parathielavia appendiculata]